ncbi:MAG: ABC transporter substrate-binding protein [Elusimicrobia bacterium]|nr:ABC transporter substrate-binding protein [Elusimicrobiota bacterium]
MTFTKAINAAVVALSVVLYSQTAVHAETGVSDKEIIIGACNDLDGPTKARGKMQTGAAKSYFDYINEKGGIHGRKIKFIIDNDRYDAEMHVECFNRLMGQNVFAAGFSIFSAGLAKILPTVQEKRVPLVGVSGAEIFYEPVVPTVFNYRVNYQLQLQDIVDTIKTKTKYKKIGVIYQDDVFGANGLKWTKLASAKHPGYFEVSSAFFVKDSTDVDKAIQTEREQKAEVIILSTVGKPIAHIVKRAKAMGWDPLFVTITTDPAVNQAEGVVQAQVVPDINDTALPTVALYRGLAEKGGAEIGYMGLEGFIQAMIVTEGLKKAGRNVTKDKFLAGLESLKNFDLGLGKKGAINFSSTRHMGTDSVFYTVVKDGKPVKYKEWED